MARNISSTQYHVTNWDTDEIESSWAKLAIAKRYARGSGHTGHDDPTLNSYPPQCYVANDDGELVYNPRFSKRVGASVGGFINSVQSGCI